MMRHSSLPRAVRPAAAASLILALAGCSLLGARGANLPGMRGRAAVPKAPPATASIYRHAPAKDWHDLVVGAPASPGPQLFSRVSDGRCQSASQGLERVLPVAEGLPANSLWKWGPLGVGVSGMPTNGASLDLPSGNSLADAMLERTSRMGTTGSNCRPSLFAYVRLGLGDDYDPVSVLR
jgi:hypothetical protein